MFKDRVRTTSNTTTVVGGVVVLNQTSDGGELLDLMGAVGVGAF